MAKTPFGFLIAILTLVSCDSPRGVPAVRALAFTRAESSAYLDPANECFFLARRLNPDPVALVAEYLRRDGQGAFLQANAWLDSVYDCPGHLPGPDMFTVVRESRVIGQQLSDSISTVFVRSTVLGEIDSDDVGEVFEHKPTVKVDTFVAVLTPYGWRLQQPQLPDNVLVDWVLGNPQRIPLRSSSRDALVQAQRAAIPNER